MVVARGACEVDRQPYSHAQRTDARTRGRFGRGGVARLIKLSVFSQRQCHLLFCKLILA